MQRGERQERMRLLREKFGDSNFTVNDRNEIEATHPAFGSWRFIGWLDDDRTIEEIESDLIFKRRRLA